MSISVEMTAATSKRGAAQMRTCKVHGQVAGHAGKEEGGQPVHPGRPLPASIPASITLLASECLLLPAASHTQGHAHGIIACSLLTQVPQEWRQEDY